MRLRPTTLTGTALLSAALLPPGLLAAISAPAHAAPVPTAATDQTAGQVTGQAVTLRAPKKVPAGASARAPEGWALRYPQVPCVQYLTPNTAYTAIHRTYRTDAIGRPRRASVNTLSQRTSPRSPCEPTVGAWGPPGYQGGHLIAATLRGVSERYNLVPMQGNQINQGLMKAIENGAKRCLTRAAVTGYTITLTYPAGTSVVPARIQVDMLPHARNPAVPFTASFRNTTYQPAGYTRLRNEIRAKFTRSGC
ncbi:DNA/RNA non-specific endonuclease [Actinomadura kijaniata]|uniref:DNA/RNA non-specific endonuclease n=1 Tax=Actinomadura kijaniata TaxID=46161 RepID=UPI000A050439|nr:DNA/RNA non-specific endonuclease [Actinomadura kijaniata]